MDSARERKAAEAAEARRAWRPAGRAMWEAARELGVGVEALADKYGKRRPPAPYPDPDRPGVYRVPLSGRGDEPPREAIVDAADLPLIEGGECYLVQAGWAGGGDKLGAAHCVSVLVPDGAQVVLRRLIMGVRERRTQVSHANGDPLDCRRSNLVVRTVGQRVRSTGKFKAMRGRPCSSRFKGVDWDKQAAKWRAQILVRGKKRHVGRFDDEIAAARAYDAAARELYGEGAYQNFPDGVDAYLEAEAANVADAPAGEQPSRAALESPDPLGKGIQ